MAPLGRRVVRKCKSRTIAHVLLIVNDKEDYNTLPFSLLIILTCHKLVSPQNVLNPLGQLIFSIAMTNDTKPRCNFLAHNNNKNCHLHNYNPRMEEIGFQSNT
jgi:hypothetical protein